MERKDREDAWIRIRSDKEGTVVRKTLYRIAETVCLILSIAGSILTLLETDIKYYVIALIALLLFAILFTAEKQKEGEGGEK